MSKKVDKQRDLTERLIRSGYRAAEELIKVAEAPIIKNSKNSVAGEDMIDFTDDLAAEKMKNAAAAKKLAIFDAFEILDKVKEKQESLDEIDGKKKEEKPKEVKKPTTIPKPEDRAS